MLVNVRKLNPELFSSFLNRTYLTLSEFVCLSVVLSVNKARSTINFVISAIFSLLSPVYVDNARCTLHVSISAM